MACPFCLIASSSPPSADPAIVTSPVGSAYPVLSTPTVFAFLDIAPVSRGHILLCPREHRCKGSDLTTGEAAAFGFWMQVLSKSVMRALWGGTEGSWNLIQANGADAGQTVPHMHSHVIPRVGVSSESSSITDEERRNLVLGEGPRDKLDPADGIKISRLVKTEIAKEIQRLKDLGELVDHGESNGALWMKTLPRGLEL